MNRFSPLVGNQDCYVFDGHRIDPIITTSRAEAEKHAEDLNSEGQRYAVVLLSPDGHWTDVTDEFWRAAPDFEDDYSEPRPGDHTRMMRRMGAIA